jgi:hypothetical protein
MGGRRAVGTASAVFFLVIAALTGRWWDQTRKERVAGEARRLAADAGRRVKDAWSVQTESLSLMTSGAAANPLLLTALRGGVDAATLADIVRNEEWWAPYRSALAALSYEDATLAFTQDADSAPLAAAVVATVRQEHRPVTRTFLAPGGRVVLLAGQPIPFSAGSPPAVLVLERPLDQRALQTLAVRTDVPVVLADDRGLIGTGGRREDLGWLRSAVGYEAAGVRSGADWSAVAAPLAPRLWIWTGARAGDFSHLLAAADRRKKRVLWLVTTLLAAAAFVAGWRRRPMAIAPRAAAPIPPEPAAEPPTASLVETGGGRRLLPAEAGGLEVALGPTGPRTPPLGVNLGRYQLVERIGEGGMAEVFSAVSFGASGFRRFFVVKRLRPEMTTNPVAVTHFIDEANLASTLVHPNIVPVFDFGEINGTYFLAQEYVVGRDLGRLRRRMIERGDRPLSPRAVFFLAHELLSGLECAHDQREDDGTALELVHRDVSPENVMISERGEVKLLDFGIVKVGQQPVQQTEIGHLKGNVDFMSPEQARGASVDRRADLFSVGLVLYYAVTGTPLYEGGTVFDRLTRAAAGPGPDEWAKLATLPAPLSEILWRALAVDPDERYQTATDFRAVVAPLMESGDAELSAAISRNFDAELRAEQDRLTGAFPRPRTREAASVLASEGSGK